MKVILVFLLIGMMFIPGTAFGWKSISSMYGPNCDFICEQSSNNYFPAPMNFILLGMTAFAVLGLYAKFSKTGFSFMQNGHQVAQKSTAISPS